MAVKEAIQSEFIKYVKEEVKEQEALQDAYVNKDHFKWYDREDGPASIHKHKREDLDREVKRSEGGPSRGMGKIAADTIAVHERLLNLRNETRMQTYVRAHVRAAQIGGALENLQEIVNAQVSA